MRTAIRYWGVLGTIGLTELLAHFLSLGWGLMTLLAAFAWVALTGASTAAKARSTEDRVAALVPAVGAAFTTASNALPKTGGTLSGSLTVNGNPTVNGNHQVNGDHTVAGNTYAAGGITGAGGGTLENSSSIHSNNTILADGQVSTGQLYVNGSRLNMVQGVGGYPISSGQAWGPSVVNVLNNLYFALRNSNVIS